MKAELKNGETNEIVIKQELIKLLEGPSNAGREYWLTVPPPYLVANPTNYTRFFIGASGDANVRISQQSGIDMSLQVPAGTAKSFDLNDDIVKQISGGENLNIPAGELITQATNTYYSHLDSNVSKQQSQKHAVVLQRMKDAYIEGLIQ